LAKGDAVIVGLTSTANNSSLTIQPGASVEWVIHNLHTPEGSAWELYRTDGSNPIKIDHDAATGRYNLILHATNAQYYTLKNVSGSTVYLAADGMVTK